MSRESEVQHLCNLILETTTDFDHCDNSGEEEHWYCPYCYQGNYKNGNIADIKHDPNCEYSIAKGLMTGINTLQ